MYLIAEETERIQRIPRVVTEKGGRTRREAIAVTRRRSARQCYRYFSIRKGRFPKSVAIS